MTIHIRTIAACLLLSVLSLLSTTVLAHTTGFARNHQQYPSIEYPGITAFVERGITLSTTLFGRPKTAVMEVDLRISQPTDANSKLPKGFTGTSLRDGEQGAFTIFLSRKPGSIAFHGQLAHEIAHLHNPNLYDVYVEGLNTLFAAKFLASEGLDWSRWERHLRSGRDPFYGKSYLLMKELESIVGEQQLGSLLHHAVNSNRSGSRMHIDIDSWLDTLTADQREKSAAAILARAGKMEQARKASRPHYAFHQPLIGLELTQRLAGK
ncbi:MAG: hypothetical protein ABW148_09725 [Sedimenticola sp.]